MDLGRPPSRGVNGCGVMARFLLDLGRVDEEAAKLTAKIGLAHASTAIQLICHWNLASLANSGVNSLPSNRCRDTRNRLWVGRQIEDPPTAI